MVHMVAPVFNSSSNSSHNCRHTTQRLGRTEVSYRAFHHTISSRCKLPQATRSRVLLPRQCSTLRWCSTRHTCSRRRTPVGSMARPFRTCPVMQVWDRMNSKLTKFRINFKNSSVRWMLQVRGRAELRRPLEDRARLKHHLKQIGRRSPDLSSCTRAILHEYD
jgi:hypothetical protein